ncbi:hypothetical protein LCGC14_0480440 [marine sediment metagenome]|uniref:Uncharacterized protein n=1 Tax=marine sediment metagenome TaxID=412755 RepID=A0A0F9UWK4_9ZZZZ|nr:hypothetical protein [Methylophaga sp.]
MSDNQNAIWTWPIVLAVLVASGLISALVSNSWGDIWSWLALGFPVGVMTFFACRRSSIS